MEEYPLPEEVETIRANNLIQCIEDAVRELPGDGYMVYRFTPEWLEQVRLMGSRLLIEELTRMLYNIGTWNICRLWSRTRLRPSPVGTLLAYNVVRRVIGNVTNDPILLQILREGAAETGTAFRNFILCSSITPQASNSLNIKFELL